jgi:3-deoxy-manno-octulosonate cytidylyltransferase (CMP-KDO synthetase)
MHELDYKIVIPARYASSRLPAKPLKDILGKPMIQHVYERAITAGANEVLIATDHPEILAVAKTFGADAVLTRDDHENGTERLAEVAAIRNWSAETLVVNVQGDEPLMPVELIQAVAENLAAHSEAGIASLASEILEVDEVFNPNAVKVVLDHQGYALYFSRAPIPWYRQGYQGKDGAAKNSASLPSELPALRHIGMYAYRVKFLQEYCAHMPVTPLEQVEALEQLRALYYGVKIHMGVVSTPPPAGVDTQEDLERVIRTLMETQVG